MRSSTHRENQNDCSTCLRRLDSTRMRDDGLGLETLTHQRRRSKSTALPAGTASSIAPSGSERAFASASSSSEACSRQFFAPGPGGTSLRWLPGTHRMAPQCRSAVPLPRVCQEIRDLQREHGRGCLTRRRAVQISRVVPLHLGHGPPAVRVVATNRHLDRPLGARFWRLDGDTGEVQLNVPTL